MKMRSVLALALAITMSADIPLATAATRVVLGKSLAVKIPAPGLDRGGRGVGGPGAQLITRDP